MYSLKSDKQESMRQNISDLQRSPLEGAFQILQQALGDKKQRGSPRNLMLNLGKELRGAGISEEKFAKFIEDRIDAEFMLMFAQLKTEWVGALDSTDDLEKIRARESGLRKMSTLDSRAGNSKETLAVAYCLKDASGEGGAEKAFSKMSEPEAEALFRVAEKEAGEHLNGIFEKEISKVFRKIAWGE